MILIVTYHLKGTKDYHDFYEVVKTQGKWWHYLASTWLLSTTRIPQEVVDAIHPQMDPQDLLFVCELAPRYQGWLPKQAWDWINAELQQPSLFPPLVGAPQPAPSPFKLAPIPATPSVFTPVSPLGKIPSLADILGGKTSEKK
jgi:hypothetical protein